MPLFPGPSSALVRGRVVVGEWIRMGVCSSCWRKQMAANRLCHCLVKHCLAHGRKQTPAAAAAAAATAGSSVVAVVMVAVGTRTASWWRAPVTPTRAKDCQIGTCRHGTTDMDRVDLTQQGIAHAAARYTLRASTRSAPLHTASIRACLCGRGARADCALKPAALITTTPTEWTKSAPRARRRPRHAKI